MPDTPSPSQLSELWQYPTGIALAHDELGGYAVRASDGSIGTVLAEGVTGGQHYLLIAAATGTLMLPAGLLARIDRSRRTVYAARTSAQIAGAPHLDSDRRGDRAYRIELEAHHAFEPTAARAI